MPATETRICEHCQTTVMGVCLCNYVYGTPINYAFPTRADELLKLYHALWKEIHSKQDATPEWFADWVRRIPSVNCGCFKWLREYLTNNPPRYDDWPTFANELHLAVSCKLDKPGWSVRTYDSITVGS
jgi:hypothetical protein